MEYLIYNWYFFNLVFGLFLVVGLIMINQSRHFYTKELVTRKFSIMELKLPATPSSLHNVIAGVYQLKAAQTPVVLGALRRHLYTDFVFMLLTYSIVFMLSFRVADKVSLQPARYIFILLGLLQAVCLATDVLANIYLLNKLGPNKPLTPAANHRMYLGLQVSKWILFVIATVCSTAAICYFWLVGNYSVPAFRSLLLVLAQLLLFGVAVILLRQSPRRLEVTSSN